MQKFFFTLLAIAALTFSACSKASNGPTAISFSKTVYEMEVGTTLQLNVNFQPKTSEGTVTWKSANTDLATVDANGLVTAIKAGKVSISASCASHGCSCIVKIEAKTQDKPGFTMRLMQFNILQSTAETAGHEWATVRKEPCFKMLKEIAPDIVCCQEARKTQCNDLAAQFPSYAQVKHPKDNTESNGGQRNLIMYRSDKFEVLDWDKYWFSVDESPSGDRFCPSGVTNSSSKTTQKMTVYVHFREKAGGRDFYVFCTHFFADVDDVSQRQKCVDLSVKHIKAIPEETPVFFCGDLNLNYSSDGAKDVLAPLFDCMQSAAVSATDHDSPTATTYNKFGESTKTLDYIFYRNATALTYKVVNGTNYGTKYISDHYPVYSDIVAGK